MNILDQILETKREEVASRKRKISARDLAVTPFAKRKTLSMRQALENVPVGIIAEFKRKSPSKGYIYENAIAPEIVEGYALQGAAACSVLTDTGYFGGSLLDLALTRKAVNIPLLRKDFIIDEYQIAEARAYGADAILLIAAAMPVAKCLELTEVAHSYGLEVLLEVHNEKELQHIQPGVDMVGVNNRNLATFVTDINTSFELAEKIPACHLKVSESGIHSMETVKALQNAGYRGFLIGERFMREKQPDMALKHFLSYAG